MIWRWFTIMFLALVVIGREQQIKLRVEAEEKLKTMSLGGGLGIR